MSAYYREWENFLNILNEIFTWHMMAIHTIILCQLCNDLMLYLDDIQFLNTISVSHCWGLGSPSNVLTPGAKLLDIIGCPSGHCMTAAFQLYGLYVHCLKNIITWSCGDHTTIMRPYKCPTPKQSGSDRPRAGAINFRAGRVFTLVQVCTASICRGPNSTALDHWSLNTDQSALPIPVGTAEESLWTISAGLLYEVAAGPPVV